MSYTCSRIIPHMILLQEGKYMYIPILTNMMVMNAQLAEKKKLKFISTKCLSKHIYASCTLWWRYVT